MTLCSPNIESSTMSRASVGVSADGIFIRRRHARCGPKPGRLKQKDVPNIYPKKVKMFQCVCVCVCVCVCLYVIVCIDVRMYVFCYAWKCVIEFILYALGWVCQRLLACVCAYVCMYVCMYMCVVCVYVYLYLYVCYMYVCIYALVGER